MNFRTHWAKLVNEGHKPNAKQHALYIIVTGLYCKHPKTMEHLKRAFTPVVNKNKKINGRKQYDTLLFALTNLRYGNLTLPIDPELESEVRIEIERLYCEIRKEVCGY